MVPELVFGLRDNKATHISEVESGLSCDCVCAKCGRRLVAKKGDIKIHHFAHEDNSDCQLALETSLHFAAKEILQREMRINLPLPGFLLARLARSINTTLEFEEVKLEQRCGGTIPDLMVFKNGRPLIIEIKVTHGVDDAKLQKIKQLGISAIEIDLTGTDCSTIDSLKEGVIASVQNKAWLYNAEEARYRALLGQWKRRHRLRAWWFDDSYTVWHCPIGKVKPACIDCEHFIDSQQNNQTGEHYRQNPDYVYCAAYSVQRQEGGRASPPCGKTTGCPKPTK